LRSAISLWTTTILVFALWYWRLDAGGPHQRDKRAGHPDGAFLFPQMTLSKQAIREAQQQDWSPNFVDYLFLSFTASTAFSPTDTPVLQRRAKILMMLQSLLSLLILVLLAARAVNILWTPRETEREKQVGWVTAGQLHLWSRDIGRGKKTDTVAPFHKPPLTSQTPFFAGGKAIVFRLTCPPYAVSVRSSTYRAWQAKESYPRKPWRAEPRGGDNFYADERR